VTPASQFRLRWHRTAPPEIFHGRIEIDSVTGWNILGVISCGKPEWVSLVSLLMRAGVHVYFDPEAQASAGANV